MDRRTYLKTVGASFALPTVLSGTSNAQEGEEQRPVYYTISVPEIDTQILHISVPKELLNNSDQLWTVSEQRDVMVNVSREDTEDPWEVLNLAVQSDDLQRVYIGGVDATRWDRLNLDKLALLTTGDASHGYLGVVGSGLPVSVEAVENDWSWDCCEYERVRVETTDTKELDVQAVVEGEHEKIPIFKMNPSYLSIP